MNQHMSETNPFSYESRRADQEAEQCSMDSQFYLRSPRDQPPSDTERQGALSMNNRKVKIIEQYEKASHDDEENDILQNVAKLEEKMKTQQLQQLTQLSPQAHVTYELSVNTLHTINGPLKLNNDISYRKNKNNDMIISNNNNNKILSINLSAIQDESESNQNKSYLQQSPLDHGTIMFDTIKSKAMLSDEKKEQIADQSNTATAQLQSDQLVTFQKRPTPNPPEKQQSIKDLMRASKNESCSKSPKSQGKKHSTKVMNATNCKTTFQTGVAGSAAGSGNSQQHIPGQPNNQNAPGGVANLKLIAQTKKRIMYFFKNFTSSGRRQYLTNMQIRWTIDDHSDYYNNFSQGMCFLVRILKSIQQRLLSADFRVHNFGGLLNPHSQLSIFFLFLFAGFNAVLFLLFSILVIYHGRTSYDQLIFLIVIIIWLAEVFVQLNTKFYKGSHLIQDRYLIVINYLNTRALADFVSIGLFAVMPEETVYRVICECFSFFKLKNLMVDIDEIQKQLCMTFRNYYMIQLINLIIKILVISHTIACAWYLIGQIELHVLESETTWYDEGLGADYTWWKLYLESMYWSLTLLTTGSNVATSLLQMFFTTFIMLFTTILFGYLMNVTGTIISQFDQQVQNKQLDLNLINDYMRTNKISKELQARVNMDIENYYKADLDRQQVDKQSILQKVSPNLQSQLKFEYAKQILDKVPIFQQRFSTELLEEISEFLEEAYFLPNQTIFTEHQHSNICLFYIVDGQVELSQSFLGDEKTEKVIQRLGKGSLLGQVNFFTGQAQDKTARSSEFTKIVRLDRDKFLEVVHRLNFDHQIFAEIRDQILTYENYELIGEKCIFCQNSTHLEKECHLIHIQKDELYQKIKFFENINQPRNEKYHRIIRGYVQHKTLKNLQEVVKVLRQYRVLFKPSLEETGVDSQSSFSENYSDGPEQYGTNGGNTERDMMFESKESIEKQQFRNNINKNNNKDNNNRNSIMLNNIGEQSEQQQFQKVLSDSVKIDVIEDEEHHQKIAALLISKKKKSEYFEDCHDEINVSVKQFQIGSSTPLTLDEEMDQFELTPPLKHLNKNYKAQGNHIHSDLDHYTINNNTSYHSESTNNNNNSVNPTKKRSSRNMMQQSVEHQKSIKHNSHEKTFLRLQSDDKQPNNATGGISAHQLSIPDNIYAVTSNNDIPEAKRNRRMRVTTVVMQKGLNSGNTIEHQRSKLPGSPQQDQGLSHMASNRGEPQQQQQQQQSVYYLGEDNESQLSIPQSITEWDFDKLQDWRFYFPKGNSKLIIVKFLKSQKKRLKNNMTVTKKKNVK